MKKLVAFADEGGAVQHDMRADLAALADADIRADHRIGANLDLGGHMGLWVDDGRGVDHPVQSNTAVVKSSAEATCLESTAAAASYFQILRLRVRNLTSITS